MLQVDTYGKLPLKEANCNPKFQILSFFDHNSAFNKVIVMSENVVILKDARKAWLSVAQLENHENEIFIFSPYITGEIMEIVKLKGISELIWLRL